ncbi:cobalamin biosynthesis protein CobD [Treponema sp. OMZ 789]|nr:cobalamin biosynthesis protein CobD [Treponema sp. OMZ 789]UTC71152.1 cobalamin biosynthesis protein CobD [Treponema sp. OMZ 790]UTC73863.1 cobalamin biosynthesis protein CobD [Treponema sp. OMZ 791]
MYFNLLNLFDFIFSYSDFFILLFALILDFILGDPHSFPHPVKFIGSLIKKEEALARFFFRSSRGLRFSGFLITLFNIVFSFCLVFFFLKLLYPYKILYFIFAVWISYTCLAARCLQQESMKVFKALQISLEEGRRQIANIVGRDTHCLDKKGISRACVETIAENTSDGVIAPLFFMMLLGPAGGIAYKAVNTMDSMLGYKNKKYCDLGFFSAKVDDIVNYIPARISALLILAGSFFCKLRSAEKDCLQKQVSKQRISKLAAIKAGFNIWRRDCRKHSSPNSAHPESAAAGLLGLRLGGPNYYGGVLVEKPFIGDEIFEIEDEDIKRCIQLMYASEVLMFGLYALLFFRDVFSGLGYF